MSQLRKGSLLAALAAFSFHQETGPAPSSLDLLPGVLGAASILYCPALRWKKGKGSQGEERGGEEKSEREIMNEWL